jgi:hypothetical protein
MYKIYRKIHAAFDQRYFKKLDTYRSLENIPNNIKALNAFEPFSLSAIIFGTDYAKNMPGC